jgi:hypothetical protein
MLGQTLARVPDDGKHPAKTVLPRRDQLVQG